MKVIVKLFGGLTTSKNYQKTEEGDIIFETSESLTLGDLVTSLSLNKKPFIIVLNGVIQNELTVFLKDGDEISLFPPIAGGK